MIWSPDKAGIGGYWQEHAPLGLRSRFRCGGQTRWLFRPETEQQLAHFLSDCPPEIPVMAFGAGSNILVRDGGFDGVSIFLGRAFQHLSLLPDGQIEAGSAVLDAQLAHFAARNGREGLEFFTGIPGTIGGALRMNAGADGTETRDKLISARFLDRQGRLQILPAEQLRLSYRSSVWPADSIALSACFRTRSAPCAFLERRLEAIRQHRQQTQPIGARTGGSSFRNPPGRKAWQLIEAAGCRGLKQGGAMVSEMHCNFFLNTGGASGDELEALGEEIRRRVFDTSGLWLEWEIVRLGKSLERSPEGNLERIRQ